MTTRLIRTLVGAVLVFAGWGGAAGVAAQELPDAGVGFVLRSTDFGDPCNTEPGQIPRIYDNTTNAPVDVSVKVTNTGASNLFIDRFVITAATNVTNRRPRVMRIMVPPNSSLGITPQVPGCGWIAVIRPH